MPSERAIYLSFDDERLGTLEVEQLSLLLEEHYRRHAELRGKQVVLWLLDEIQLVPGWERFVRRILDTERVEIVVSGASAKMLSREVHTSLRGRGIETQIQPFSFREHLRHRGTEPVKPPSRWTSADRSRIERAFREYLIEGGFPEAQGLPMTVRFPLLQGYVETVMFRDVVERHGITQVAALRWLIVRIVGAPEELIQVCADVSDPATLAREVRALQTARREHPRATCRLLLLGRLDRPLDVGDVVVQSIPEWLLTSEPE